MVRRQRPRPQEKIKARPCSRGVARPRNLFGEPFMLSSANWAVDPREEDRHRFEALAIGDQTGGDVPSGLRTSHHNGSHWPLLLYLVRNRYAAPVKII